MNWTVDWGLRLRMLLTLCLLAVVTVVLAGTIAWTVSSVVALLTAGTLSPEVHGAAGVGVAVLVVVGFAVTEWRRGGALVLRRLDTRHAIDPEFPALVDTVRRLAHQAELPAPDVVVASSSAPNSFATGTTPERAALVVTEGLLDLLDEDELEAVLAHELSHLKNRDAMVMTVASVPLVIADWLNDWTDDRWAASAEGSGDVGILVFPPIFVLSGAFWGIGRALVRALARYRERAADRAAVALSGSPAALASALRKIDAGTRGVPYEDLRRIDGAAHAFGIVAMDSERDALRLGPEGDRLPLTYRLSRPLRPVTERFFATHPPIDERITELRRLQDSL